tara:strand:- start:127 stop:669 length:543 start_codon:yes stop_codon:yes gene_type:complete
MATVNLLPNADLANDWTLSTGSDLYEVINEDNTGAAFADGSTASTTTAGHEFYVALTNFTEDFSSIDSVQVVVRAGVNSRGATFRIRTALTDSAGSPNILYDETSGTQNASIGYRTITFTSRTTSDGSSAWTNTDLNNLRLLVEADVLSTGTCRCTFAYAIVTYTEPVATDNAVFFGTNF